MQLNINQQDNRTSPVFAVVVHHGPYQLIAILACLSVREQLFGLQPPAHAYQQPASNVQVRYQQSAGTKPAQPNSAHMLTVNVTIHVISGSLLLFCSFSHG